jgi:hypothetical protein
MQMYSYNIKLLELSQPMPILFYYILSEISTSKTIFLKIINEVIFIKKIYICIITLKIYFLVFF